MIEFAYAAVDRVIIGRGAAVKRLRSLLMEHRIDRVLVVTGPKLQASDGILGSLAPDVTGALFEVDSRGLEVSDAVATCAADISAQAFVTVGGTNVVEAAKGASILLTDDSGRDTILSSLRSGHLARNTLDARKPPIFCVPSELEGAEFNGGTEITTIAGRGMYKSPTLYARAVLLDADVADETSARDWSATGLKLLDHAVERILSTMHNPLIDLQSLAGMRIIDGCLAASVERSDPALREFLLAAVWLIQSNNGSVGGGYSHSLSRELRTQCGAPLGVGTAAFLPAVLRWCATSAPDRFGMLADGLALDVTDPIGGVIARVEGLIREVGLQVRLRDLGLTPDDVTQMAERSFADRNVRSSPWQPRSAEELASLIGELM